MNESRPKVAHLAAASIAAGLGMYMGDYPVHLPALQWFTLAPLLYLVLARKYSAGQLGLAGALYGVFSSLMVLHLGMGLLPPFIMVLYQAAWGIVLFLCMALLLRLYRTSLVAALAFPVLVVSAEFLSQQVFRMWGTAQSFSRVQTVFPFMLQFTSVTGQAGAAFLVALANSTLAGLFVFFREKKRLLIHVLTFVVVMGACLAYNIAIYYYTGPSGTIKVAAAGWAKETSDFVSWRWKLDGFERLIEESGVDYRLIVYPEVAFRIYGEMPEFTGRLASISKKFGIYQFAGYFDEEKDLNGIMLAAPDGKVRSLYYKTHLVKFIEDYNAGSGAVGTVDIDGTAVGGLICQDDNFQDIARSNALKGAQIVVIPTNDWEAVKDYHAENMIYRAIENGLSVVRAASGGITSIIDYRGVVIARRDPFEEKGGGGETIVTAALPVREGMTFFTRFGNLFSFACMFVLLLFLFAGFIRRKQ